MKMMHTLLMPVAMGALLTTLPAATAPQDGKFTTEVKKVAAVDVSPVVTADTVERTHQLMELVKENAADIRANAARLKSMTRFPQMSAWQTHAAKLQDTRGHLLELGGHVDHLYDLVRVLLPRQREALEHIAPELPELIMSLDQAIKFANENRGQFWSDGYAEHLDQIYDSADAISEASELAMQFFTADA